MVCLQKVHQHTLPCKDWYLLPFLSVEYYFDLTGISHNFSYFSVKKMKALHRQEDKQEQAKGLPLHLVPKIIDQTRLPRKQKARNQSVD